MGYSRSVATVLKRRELLLPLFRGDSQVVWHSTAEQAPKLAYEIRECLAIARRRPEQLPELAQLAGLYTVMVKGKDVVAVRVEAIRTQTETARAPSPTDIPLVFPFVDSSAVIIQHWIDSQPGTRSLVFQHAELSEPDLGEVVRFGASIDPPWEVIRDGLTLTLRLEVVSL